MILYEFNYRKGKVTKNVYDVKETKSLYILEKGHFDCVFVSRIKKDTIGKINYQDSYFGYTMFLLTDDSKTFMTEVIKLICEKIQRKKDELSNEEKNLEKAMEYLSGEEIISYE